MLFLHICAEELLELVPRDYLVLVLAAIKEVAM